MSAYEEMNSAERWDLAIPGLEEDDVSQEAFLVKLMGKPEVSKAIIRKRLSRQLGEAMVFSVYPDGAVTSAFPGSIVDRESIQSLVLWAQTQSLEIQAVIYHFLEEPDESLKETIQKLIQLRVIKPSKKVREKSGSLSKLLLRSLPANFEDLVKIVNRQITTARPDATVRQFVRSYSSRGLVVMNERTRCYEVAN